jgi:ABC-type uncharacterized transport system substrate-binding protein
MKRRAFIMLLGSAAAWPLAARAQQPAQPAKIGVLYPGLASALPSRITAFWDGLQAVGYREPDNIELVLRSAGGDPTRITPLAMELVERKVDVIVAITAPAVKAAQSATTTTPIVAFDSESDPIGSGLIKSLSRAGGQVTGVFFDFPEGCGPPPIPIPAAFDGAPPPSTALPNRFRQSSAARAPRAATPPRRRAT